MARSELLSVVVFAFMGYPIITISTVQGKWLIALLSFVTDAVVLGAIAFRAVTHASEQ